MTNKHDEELTEVLIVGAGPSGLAMAWALAHRGVRIRIIDKSASRSDKSKALGVQAGTLEALRRFFGETGKAAVEEMLISGHAVRRACIHFDDLKPVCAGFDGVPGDYPFVLLLEQSETERILEAALGRLGVRIERETTLVSLERFEDRVQASLRDGEGREHEVSSDYLIGCDGAHSTTRQFLGIPFVGGSYEGNFLLADARVNWPFDHESVHAFNTARGVLACFPLPRGRVRLIAIPRERSTFDVGASDLSFEELARVAHELSNGAIRVEEAFWLTRFRLHHRITDRLRKGRGFLVGDAAHIHSPIGGQGMNTGIRDALNLADKLAHVIREDAHPRLLDDYEHERLPVARKIVRGTDALFRIAMARETKAFAWVRRRILPWVVSRAWLQRRMVRAMSQVLDRT